MRVLGSYCENYRGVGTAGAGAAGVLVGTVTPGLASAVGTGARGGNR